MCKMKYYKELWIAIIELKYHLKLAEKRNEWIEHDREKIYFIVPYIIKPGGWKEANTLFQNNLDLQRHLC